MSIFIEKSKLDIYRYGAWAIIARTNSKLCPVSNLLKLINLLGIEDENSDQYIFCDLSACRSGYRIRSDKKVLSYSALRELFRNTFKPHVCDINKYGLHSLRSGWGGGGGGALLELLISELLIDYLRDMDGEEVKLPKMTIGIWAKSKILSSVAPHRKKNLVTIFSSRNDLGP